MMWPSFKVRVPGKWILSGEHAVLRGATAIALPHPNFAMALEFQPHDREGLSILPVTSAAVVRELLDAVMDSRTDARRLFSELRGTLRIESTIPEGAGLGSSAALCVALTRWLAESLSIPEGEWFEFARQLEHRFHGRSSGMDVAVISTGQPLSFSLDRGFHPLGLKRLPRFTFHDSGLRARTSECVSRVERFREESPRLAIEVDAKMAAVSREALEGLLAFDSGDSARGLERIARAMNQAQDCFHAWSLVPDAAKRMREDLMARGALAAKLTGAGGGGMLVAVWPSSESER